MRKDRIEARLEALGITQFEAAERAGKNTHFIYDFLAGKKRTFKGDGPELVAAALECSVDYLNGDTDEVGGSKRRKPVFPSTKKHGGLPFRGIVEADAFHRAGSRRIPDELIPIAPDMRFPNAKQGCYLVRGEGLDALGIHEGTFLTTVPIADYAATEGGHRPGDVVVLEHTRFGGREVEISARELVALENGGAVYACRSTDAGHSVLHVGASGETAEKGGYAKVVAVVVGATKLFASASALRRALQR